MAETPLWRLGDPGDLSAVALAKAESRGSRTRSGMSRARRALKIGCLPPAFYKNPI